MIINQTIAKSGTERTVNPNLLDNWYFGNPVNQRGKTSYRNDAGDLYCIDRWMGAGGFSGMTVNSGYVTTFGIILQRLEHSYSDEDLTFSVLYSDGTLGETSDFKNIYARVGHGQVQYLTTGDAGIYISAGQDTLDIVAMKMELGAQQTLAHQENGVWVLNEVPDVDKEQWKCMKFFQKFRSGSGYWTQSLPTRAAAYTPEMRVNPAVSTITVSGITYKTASADL